MSDAEMLDRAIRTLPLFGDRSHCDRFEPFLTDRRRLFNVPFKDRRNGTLLCDSALVALVRLTDQNPADYEVEYLRGKPSRGVGRYPLFRFPSRAARATAMEKWQEWTSRRADATSVVNDK
jgi:hypothetical protein